MSGLILFVVRFFEKVADRYTAYYISPRRRFHRRHFFALSLISVFAAAAFVVVPSLPIQSAFQQKQPKPLPRHIAEHRAKLPPAASARDGKLYFFCNTRTSPRTIAREFYDFSHVFGTRKLAAALEETNPGAFVKGVCKPGSRITIPQPALEPIQNRPLGWDLRRSVKAIYLRGENSTPRRLERELPQMKASGVNAVVFDVKDILGVVNYETTVPEVEALRSHRPAIRNLPKLIRHLHSHGIYVIARMALFQDMNLAKRRPDLAIRDAGSPTGTLLWKGKPLWVDPGRNEVQIYNIKIAQELVRHGVDEIQFDYVRYPAEGNLKQVSYHKIKSPADKTANLVRFLAAADMLRLGTDVRLSIDIFGVVAWGEDLDINATGQRIEKLAPFVDVISPMLYPSHFNRGFDGFKQPADQPYYFYDVGVQKVLERAHREGIVVRPWLQAFKWRVTNYNEAYIREQIRGNHAGGGIGWLMWNAGNKYEMVYGAIRGMKDPAPEPIIR